MPLDIGAVRRVFRLAGEVAMVSLVAGASLGLVRSWPDIVRGFVAPAICVTSAEAISALLWGLGISSCVFIAVGAARLANRGSFQAVLIGLALAGLPVFLRAALWVNERWLPGFLELKSVAWNAVMTIAFVALLLAVAPLVHSRWRAAGRSDAAALWAPWLLAAGFLAAAPAVRATSRPPVLLIVIDALRADHLGCYGYGRATSPNLDRLSRDGVRFMQAISSSTFTKTSIASLMTGLDPHLHGVYLGNTEDTAGRIMSDVLPNELVTLAEVLLRGRYRTMAWIEQVHLRSFHGFAQGYTEYHENQGKAVDITEYVRQWTQEWGGRGPFFAHLHLIDLHDPYRPRPPYDSLFGSYSDVYRGIDFQEWGKYLEEIREGRRPLSGADVEQLRALYDGQIRYVDDQLGSLFEELRRSGLYDRSLIVVTADHGDGFMEHGFISHSTMPYEELVRVPLLIKLPGQRYAGRSVGDQVRLIDVMPTILEVARLDSPRVSGQSLLPLLEGRTSEHSAPAVIEFNNPRGAAIRERAWKYIQLLDGRVELYHLAEDPGERHNLAKEATGEVARFEPRVQGILARRNALATKRVPLDASTIERLRALGYVQ
jgi:arylsulfatase A-like enzyme